MNKYILMILLLANGSLAHAAPYVGVNVGESFTSIKSRLTYPVPDTNPAVASTEMSYTSFHIQALAGYDFHTASKWDIAIEGDIDYTNDSAHNKVKSWFIDSNAEVETKLNYGYSLFLLPKYRYAENIRFFMGPGFSQEKFFVRSSATTGGNLGVTGRNNKWLTGFGLKAGADVVLTPNMNLVLTYEYMNFDDVKWSRVEPLSGQVLSAKYSPIMNAVMVGVTWHG